MGSLMKVGILTIVKEMNGKKYKSKRNNRLRDIWVRANTRFKIGMRIKITRCLHGHEFEIGEVVKIIGNEREYDLSLSWLCRNGHGIEWYISEQEGIPEES